MVGRRFSDKFHEQIDRAARCALLTENESTGALAKLARGLRIL